MDITPKFKISLEGDIASIVMSVFVLAVSQNVALFTHLHGMVPSIPS